MSPNAAPIFKSKTRSRKRYDEARGTSSQRGYDSKWGKIRAIQLQLEPLCRTCGREGIVKAAKEIDHIIPRKRGGTDDFANLQSLCHRHHSEKTFRESREK